LSKLGTLSLGDLPAPFYTEVNLESSYSNFSFYFCSF